MSVYISEAKGLCDNTDGGKRQKGDEKCRERGRWRDRGVSSKRQEIHIERGRQEEKGQLIGY